MVHNTHKKQYVFISIVFRNTCEMIMPGVHIIRVKVLLGWQPDIAHFPWNYESGTVTCEYIVNQKRSILIAFVILKIS